MSHWRLQSSKPMTDEPIVVVGRHPDGTAFRLRGLFRRTKSNHRLFHVSVNGELMIDNMAWKRAELWRYECLK